MPGNTVGTGLYFDAIAATGRTVVDVDISVDQLTQADDLGHPLVRPDASALPIADSSVGLVTAIWLSTDVDDFGAVLTECARVLPLAE